MPIRSTLSAAVRQLPVVGKIARQRDELRAVVNQLWQPPGHFYSPIPSSEDLARHFTRADDALRGIDLNADAQLALLRALDPVVVDGRRYQRDNLAYGPVDASIWAALLAHWRPARVIEVGSGYSTAVLMDTAERLGATMDVTLIEPYPALVQSLLRSADRVRILGTAVQDVPLAEFDRLKRGDVLFIDSTHVCKTGSDVNCLYFDVLPRLADGVLVHVHDVFYPFDYPQEWAAQGRAWNEAYLLRAFLLGNSEYEIVLWSSWLAEYHGAALASTVPVPPAQRLFWDPASIWLRKRQSMAHSVSSGP